MRSANEILRDTLGNLAIQIIELQAQIEALTSKLAAAEAVVKAPE